MKFVVPIPLWLYLAFALVAFSAGVTAMYVILAVSFIYLLISQPRQVFGFLMGIALMAAVFKYWKITLLVLLCAVIFKYMFRKNEVLPHEENLPEVDEKKGK
jgi:hypothetical protein